MYTTMFSLLLATTGLASGAQEPCTASYGSYGSYGTYGGYGGYGGYGCSPGFRYGYGYGNGNGPHVPYVFPPSWQIDAPREDPVVKDLKKNNADLSSSIAILMQKMKDLEKSIELRTDQDNKFGEIKNQIAQTQKDLQDKMAEFLAKINENKDRNGADISNAKLAELIDSKVAKALASLKKDDAPIMPVVLGEDNTKSLKNQIDTLQARLDASGRQEELLAKLIAAIEASARKDTGSSGIAQALVDLKLAIGKLEMPPPTSRPITGGVSITRSLIIVHLPADAELFLDNMPSKVGTNLRTFISPDLEINKNYFYTLRVELNRGGKVFTETYKIFFQAGREYDVNFSYLETRIANELKLMEKKD